MNKTELRFLIRLNDDITRACQVLGVQRTEFMAHMDFFFDTVSLGMELALQMKGKKKASEILGKAAPKKTLKVGKHIKLRDRSDRVVVALKKKLEKGPMRLQDLTEAVSKLLGGLVDPGQTMWKILTACPDIEKVPKQRGFYRLKTAKKPKKTSKSVSNGKAATTSALN